MVSWSVNSETEQKRGRGSEARRRFAIMFGILLWQTKPFLTACHYPNLFTRGDAFGSEPAAAGRSLRNAFGSKPADAGGIVKPGA
jgi:hypothetical protein